MKYKFNKPILTCLPRLLNYTINYTKVWEEGNLAVIFSLCIISSKSTCMQVNIHEIRNVYTVTYNVSSSCRRDFHHPAL